ncbi:MAG: hypothetical protein FJZ87_04680 [Chloroflexi bacterium]|nr:hypothetical protein [Chloroflexota bacterium]
MPEPIFMDDLSVLDKIRLVEAEITRKIVSAREAAEGAIVEARGQAALLKKQAGETGEREGQIRYKQMIAQAEEQAKVITAQAQNEMDNLRRKGQSRMEQAIHMALNIVLTVKGGRTSDES